MEGIAKSAVNILEEKYFPKPSKPDVPGVFTPEEQYKQLFNMLDIWDSDREDEDVQTKTKFIYEALGENPRDKLMSIFTEIGATPPDSNKLSRVYKLLRLKSRANKILNQYGILQKEIHGFRTG